jgi:hypothetical protein
MRGRVDVAIDIIGRCVVAHRSDGTASSGKILEGLCLAARELAVVAETLEGELRARLQPVA